MLLQVLIAAKILTTKASLISRLIFSHLCKKHRSETHLLCLNLFQKIFVNIQLYQGLDNRNCITNVKITVLGTLFKSQVAGQICVEIWHLFTFYLLNGLIPRTEKDTSIPLPLVLSLSLFSAWPSMA